MCEEIEKCKEELYQRLNLKMRENVLREIESLCEKHGIGTKEIEERRAK